MAKQHQPGSVLEAKRSKLAPPPLYRVLLLNDDFTPITVDGRDALEFTFTYEGSDGNMYGTTGGGGRNTNLGTVFKVTPTGALTPRSGCRLRSDPCETPMDATALSDLDRSSHPKRDTLAPKPGVRSQSSNETFEI